MLHVLRLLIIGLIASTTQGEIIREGGINIWFGYVKEELACFSNSSLKLLIGDSGPIIQNADMVVLLLLAHRPSKADMDADRQFVDFGTTASCAVYGSTSFDYLMASMLRNRSFLQIYQYSEGDPKSPDQSLLSIWYDPIKVNPLPRALAYKNKFGGDVNSCVDVKPAKGNGGVYVSYDLPVTRCAQSTQQNWPEYASAKSSLVTAWIPNQFGIPGKPFAIFGSNLPALYGRGKNEMLQRAMADIQDELGVSQDRVFIIGDMNSRLLNSFYDICTDYNCKEPDIQKQRELSDQKWESIEGRKEEDGGVKPCTEMTAFKSKEQCEERRKSMESCRLNCIAKMICSKSLTEDEVEHLEASDSKRSMGNIDLLPHYFEFPPDNFDTTGNFAARLFTYKRIPNMDVPECQQGKPGTPMKGLCTANPCLQAATGFKKNCMVDVKKCFNRTAGTVADMLPPTDPVRQFFTPDAGSFVKPQIGWLDTVGYTKGFEGLNVGYFQDRLSFTSGDHSAFIAAVGFATEFKKATVSPKMRGAAAALQHD